MYSQLPQSQIQEIRSGAAKVANNFNALAIDYATSLLPIANWIRRYNLKWFVGDFIAGVTVGLVVIPQAISYSTKLANLPAQFGLYSSFVGVFLYSLFATSKDATVGPTAVLSLLVGQSIANVIPNAQPLEMAVFAATLSFWVGVIQLLIGLFRIGLLVDFVPIPVISGFTAGAGLQIVIGQLPNLFGVKNINTNNAPYRVLGDFFQALGGGVSKYDTIFGLTALFFIFLFKYGFGYLSKRVNWFKYVGYLRNTIVLIIYTGVSYALRNNKSVTFSIVKNIPSGLSGILQPNLQLPYASQVFQVLPGVLIVSILEHTAVTKTYGRSNGYNPDGNQEIIALGISNLIGSFVGAYPATGSFSRSAIQSASGVRSPMAPFITGIVVIIALFTITGVLYYVPSAVLAAIVVGAISELFVNFKVVNSLFQVELLDFLGFWLACIVTFFASIEIAIYSSVGYSVLVLLIRVARPKVKVLTRAESGAWVDEDDEGYFLPPHEARTLTPAPEGILVFKIEESLTFPNSTFFLQRLKNTVISKYLYTGVPPSKGDAMWCDDLQQRAKTNTESLDLPRLRAVVLDFSSINNVDYTGLQTLLDAKEDLERFTGHAVPLHFVRVRRRYLNTVLRAAQKGVTAASVDATPSAPGSSSQNSEGSTNKWKVGIQGLIHRSSGGKTEEEARTNALRYFHFSLDNAVHCADKETSGGVVDRESTLHAGESFLSSV